MRDVIQLVSTAGTGFADVTTKNKRTGQGKLETKKHDPIARKHVVFVEKGVSKRSPMNAIIIDSLPHLARPPALGPRRRVTDVAVARTLGAWIRRALDMPAEMRVELSE